MEASFTKWFGEPIYISKINNFDEINKKIVPKTEKDISPTNSQYARTTDVKPKELQSIDDNLHLNKDFEILYTEIRKHILEYLEIQKYNLNVFDIYILKSWATYSLNDQFLHMHKHMASHFSFVYYPKADKQGNLRFVSNIGNDTHMYIPSREEYFTKFDDTNFSTTVYPAETGNIIIFPSKIFHETELNKTNAPRISISGDILITMKSGVKSEHCFPSPSTWKKL